MNTSGEIEVITYIDSQVSFFNFHICNLAGFLDILDINDGSEQPKRQSPAFTAMAIRIQRQTTNNVIGWR